MVNRNDWLNTLKSDIEKTSKQQWFEEKISRHIKEKGFIIKVDGVFGDTFPNFGYVEEYLETDKGIQIKFYGCSIFYNGDLKRETIDSVATTKRAMMVIAAIILKFRFFLVFYLLFYKKLVRDFIFKFAEIYEADLRQKAYKSLSDFSPVPREIIRAGMELTKEIPLEYPLNEYGEVSEIDYRMKVEYLFWCLGTIIQNDTAYYWRVQDPLSNLNKGALKRNPKKEIARLFDLAIERENQIKDKIHFLKKFFMLLLWFPPAKRLALKYLLELDIDKIQPNEDDLYWASRRDGYNFMGLSVAQRSSNIEAIDKEKGHLILR